MNWFRRVPKDFDLDKELEQAERDVWRSMFETSQKMKPGDEFARRLESRLRTQVRTSQVARGAPIRPLDRPALNESGRALAPLRSTSAFQRGESQLRGRMLNFAMGAVRLSVLIVVVLGMAVLWRGGLRPTTGTTVTNVGPVGPTRSYEELMREFLPPGKVRHLVIEHGYTPVPGNDPNTRPQAVTGRQEVWLAAGGEHPVMRTQADRAARDYSFTRPVPDIEGFWTVPVVSVSALVDEDFIYEDLDEPVVIKHPFTSRYLVPFLPSDGGFPGFIYESLSRVTGYTTLRDRPVVLLEDLSPVPPVTRRAPSRNEPNHYVANTYVALDTHTRQLVQARRVTTFISGSFSGQQAINTFDLVVDELKDASEFPPDFFKLTPSQEQRAKLYTGDKLFYDARNPGSNGSALPDGTPAPPNEIMLPAVTDVLTDTEQDRTLSP